MSKFYIEEGFKNLEEKRVFCDKVDCFVPSTEFGVGMFFSSQNFVYEAMSELRKYDLFNMLEQAEEGEIVLQKGEKMWYATLKNEGQMYKRELRYYIKDNVYNSYKVREEKEKKRNENERVQRIKKGEVEKEDFSFIVWDQRERLKELFPQLEKICKEEFEKQSDQYKEKAKKVTRSLGAFCSAKGHSPFEQLCFEINRIDQAAHGDAWDILLSGSFATIVGEKEVTRAFPGDCYSVTKDHPNWRDDKAVGNLCPTRLEEFAFSSIESLLGYRILSGQFDKDECGYSHSEIFATGGWKKIEKVIIRPFQLSTEEAKKIINLLEIEGIKIEISRDFAKMWTEAERLTLDWGFDVQNATIQTITELKNYLNNLDRKREEEEFKYGWYESLVPANSKISLWD